MTLFDLAVIGAGPAGLAAAIEAAGMGLAVVVLDEQAAPGGQVHRAIERRQSAGEDDRDGLTLVTAFRSCGATYWPETSVWQAEKKAPDDGFGLYCSREGISSEIRARRLLIATGAMERPVPFPGWTLPGVMTVGAAQILLKTGGNVPDGRVVIAGQGPLALLYMTQLLKAGVRPAAFLDTTPSGALGRALPDFAGALQNVSQVAKGLRFMASIRNADIPVIRNIEHVEAVGDNRIRAVRYRANGVTLDLATELLLVHEGVVPHTHFTMALGLEHRWDDRQCCWQPVVDADGRASVEGISVAGDGAGIGGWRTAELAGRIVGMSIAAGLGRKPDEARLGRLRRKLARFRRLRPFLDSWFRPREALLAPADDVVVCRCEEKTAGDLRMAIRQGCLGPNQVKSYTRCGMGPCQGRECGLTLTTLVARERGIAPGEAGALRIRPPLKPLTLGELASLAPLDT